MRRSAGSTNNHDELSAKQPSNTVSLESITPQPSWRSRLPISKIPFLTEDDLSSIWYDRPNSRDIRLFQFVLDSQSEIRKAVKNVVHYNVMLIRSSNRKHLQLSLSELSSHSTLRLY
ncbi:hypothetical protein N7471_014031 [Penicillium samsonianum]|uniref:uncharacterized protein n=1 Tax=Penicillium samsonianum TaxID=1882272 RepID=UPI00254915EA|nr:uncharacterized protein N7471_014031 [Penicillium samsonianum]KAJ6118154.1 hypothetical protein N7471_014031 [Penicillium samsonianum]